jgi:hypothetical protein
MLSECKYFTARTLYPNTEESDRKKFVMHVVKFTWRDKRKEMHVMDTDPHYAIESAKESIAKLDEKGMEGIVNAST